jgi:hypothetical protein
LDQSLSLSGIGIAAHMRFATRSRTSGLFRDVVRGGDLFGWADIVCVERASAARSGTRFIAATARAAVPCIRPHSMVVLD